MKKLLSIIACLVMSMTMMMAQITTVTGQVYSNEDGEPIVGASVVDLATGTGTITDLDGKFSLKIPVSSKTLTISYVGMATREVPVKAKMSIALESSSEILDDVVVVAYGVVKKESLTGSVAVVDSKEIEKRIGSSVTGALEGSTPGVQVNNTYGEPGAAPSIRIRGFSSLEANGPLYVVDGVPFDGNISEINPADIEAMSVLKDASSAALYGNRASNGVILITTKSGKGGSKPTVNLQINHGLYTRGIPEYDRLNADQFMEASWIALKNYTMTGAMGLDEAAAREYATAHLIGDYLHRNIYNKADDALFDANGKLVASILPGYTDLDWNKDIERVGQRQEYNLSASAANEKMTMYASIGYLKENGYIKTTDYERYTGRVNTTFTPIDHVKAGINISGTHAVQNYNSNAYGSYYSNPFYTNRMRAPIYPLFMHNPDGSYMFDENGEKIYDTTSSYLDNRNISYEFRENKQEKVRNVIGAQTYLTVTLPYGFSATAKADVNYSTSNSRKFDNPEIGDGATNNGRYTTSAYQYTTTTMQQLLNWNHSYGKHNIDAMIGHESYAYIQKYISGMNTGMAVPNNLVLGNFLTNSYFEGYDDEDKLESYIARARYNYNEKYFAEASFRRDGSSRFHPDNRWGNFYSMGFSWNMKKEAFLEDASWIDMLKVRTSYGEVGNNAGVSLYGYMALYEIDKNAGQAALIKSSLSAKDLKWETTQTVDFGIDGRLFNRVNFSMGYFDKRSKDLLFQVRLPLSVGSTPHGDTSNMTQWKNIGTISNRGFEFNADVDVIKSGSFTWNVGLDLTAMKNEIIKLPEGKDIRHGMQNYSEGHSIYEFHTYHFEGVDQLTGRSLYTLDPEMKDNAQQAGALVNINGTDYTTQTTYGLRDWAGSALPKVYGAFNTSLSWKNVTVSALFTYSLGGKTVDGSYQSLMSTNTASSADALHKDILKSWSEAPAGMTETSANRIDPKGFPQLNIDRSSDNNSTSDRWLTSASYLVFKNIYVAYNLPHKLLNPLKIQGLQVTAGVENMFTLASRKGLNPQYSFNGGSDDTYVTPRVFNLGVSLKF